MFDAHQSQIGAYAKRSPDNLARVLTFVLCTIQEPLERVSEAMASIDAQGENSPYLWGFKRSAYIALQANKETLYEQALAIWDGIAAPEEAGGELLHLFASQAGFGLAKGGFAVQLCFGVSGCLDSHNLARFGFDENAIKASRFKNAKKYATRAKYVNLYRSLLEQAGGGAELWNSWCNYVAELRPDVWGNGFAVSEYHCNAIME